MEEIDFDIDEACKLESPKLQRSNNYSKVYLNSNEKLERLFENFSVKDKDVLTVLASSDQYFRCLYNGAKSVDTFDINKLAKYYYYIRKWYMEQMRKHSIAPCMISRSNNWVHELLPNVKIESTDEEYAYIFWKRYLEEKQGRYFFHLTESLDNFDYAIEKILAIIKNKPLNFSNIDICKEGNSNKKYDIIILSNILEWHAYESETLKSCKTNLERLLKDDGKIICSCVAAEYIDSTEIEIFQDDFKCERFYWDKGVNHSNSSIQGYCYQKK